MNGADCLENVVKNSFVAFAHSIIHEDSLAERCESLHVRVKQLPDCKFCFGLDIVIFIEGCISLNQNCVLRVLIYHIGQHSLDHFAAKLELRFRILCSDALMHCVECQDQLTQEASDHVNILWVLSVSIIANVAHLYLC